PQSLHHWQWQEIRFRIYSPHYAFALFLRDFFPSQRQLKVTVTERSAFMVTVHAFPGESHPDQLPNVEPLLGVAVSVTVVPSTKCAMHVPVDGPQSMPTGTLVTTPLPLPVGTTEKNERSIDASKLVKVEKGLNTRIGIQKALKEWPVLLT